MDGERNKQKKQRIEDIEAQLEILKDDELDQLSYFLSCYREAAQSQTTAVPMHFLGRFLGISQNQDGTAEMKLGLQNENTYGVAQGGSIYTLADVAIGFGILKNLLDGEKVFTLELKVNFIEIGQGSRLIATPVILRQGKRTVVAECSITDEAGKLVAKALGTFYITRMEIRREGG